MGGGLEMEPPGEYVVANGGDACVDDGGDGRDGGMFKVGVTGPPDKLDLGAISAFEALSK